jgi:arginine decarboxylase
VDLWTSKKSSELYGIDSWGSGFFRINDKGHVEVTPQGQAPGKPGVDLKAMVDDLQERGLRTPLLIRFPDIVQSRIQTLARAFEVACRENKYTGTYRGVYPIKVNQQRFLVEEITQYGRAHRLGLEAGSKPELLIALALMDNPEALVICNGFKDREYIETALLAQKLGRNAIIVTDRFSEIDMIIQAARALGIRPRIGFRAKLEAKGAGKWVESSGAKSKFGLTVTEMLKGVEMLEKAGMVKSLELLHFHIGSQITSLRAIRDSMVEASRVYVELAALGAGLRYLDVGGGLGVDYDGSQTNWENSMNYTVSEYANHVVAQIGSACDDKGIAHPDIITEAGRALVAHHSVLVFDVVGSHEIHTTQLDSTSEKEEHETIVEMRQILAKLSARNLNESIQDMLKLREDGMSLFNLGYMNLKQRAMMENIFWVFATRAIAASETINNPPEEVAGLKKLLTDSYYCNFSVFQSAPDTWAVKQLFPIMPIHRLTEKPTRRGVLLDLTCDSDGKIDRFIDIKDVKESLELHPFEEGKPYYMGMFLVGAYQEILGDFHNLFGDTDAVHVSVSASGSYTIDHIVEGDTVNEVLSYVEYDRASLVRQVRGAIELALSNKTISLEESRLLMRYYEEGLNGYTYLDKELADSDFSAVESLRKLGQRMQAESSGALAQSSDAPLSAP